MREINETLSRAAACEKTVLPSGLTVLVRPMPGYGSVHAVMFCRGLGIYFEYER